MKEGGWIKLYRSIRKHWLWEDAEKLKWWLDILIQANHKEKKILLGNELVLIERGSFHTSILKLSELWKADRKTVKKFLELLEKDNMISIKTSKKGTTIKVCNYKDYQSVSESEKDNKVDVGVDNDGTRIFQRDGQLYGCMRGSNIHTNKNDKEKIKNYEEREKDCDALNSLSVPTSTHKLFLDRFGETAYRTWLMDCEFSVEGKAIKIFVEQEFYKKALEKYTDTLEILTEYRIAVEVKS